MKKNLKSKTVVDPYATLNISAEFAQKIEQVKAEIEAITENATNEQLLDYIKTHGTPVFRHKNAAKKLRLIVEEEGLITELRGGQAFYIKFITGHRTPMFFVRTGELNRFGLLHQFYKWYSMKSGLPGFDYPSQKLFKQYMRGKFNNKLGLEQMLGLKEAIARDKEATDFAYAAACAEEGTKQAFDKLNNGGASV